MAYAQPPQSYSQGPSSYGEGEPGKCYAQCLKTEVDTVWYECETKPEWVVPKVGPTYPNVVPTTYVVEEACTTCGEKVKTKNTCTKDTTLVVQEAYCEYVVKDPVIVKETQRILVREGYWKYTAKSPGYATTKTVTVTLECEGNKAKCQPPTKGVRYEDVMIEEECVEIDVREYIWTTTVKWDVCGEASTKWVRRPGDENCLSADPEDCMVWCEIEVPAPRCKCEVSEKGCPYGYTDNGEYCIKTKKTGPKFKKVKVITCEAPPKVNNDPVTCTAEEKVKVSSRTSGTLDSIWIPEEYKDITIEVVKEPGGWDKKCYDAVKETITLKVDCDNEKIATTTTPERTESCDLTKCVEPQIETEKKGPIVDRDYVLVTNTRPGDWVEVLCPADVTSYTIREIQRALSAKGYDPGPIDNVLGAQTKSALQQFQRDYGLPVGQLDLQTLAALGISF